MGQPEQHAARRPGRYAAIDIGTVTCRMLLADVDACGTLHELRREYAITNLGEGVDASGVLRPAAMERVAATVARYRQIIADCADQAHPQTTVIAFATSAARDAENAADFAALLEGLGVHLSVIPGAKEAALSFRGASCGHEGERLLVVDVGGGSTEVVAGRGGEDPERAHSFDIGCRRVTEKFLAGDPPTDAEIGRARAWIEDGMRAYFAELRGAGLLPAQIIAVAGTATSVVSIHERMAVYDSARVHGAQVPSAVLDEVYRRLREVPLAERRRIVGLDPERAGVIVAGMLILQAVLSLADAPGFTASETDILQGAILDAATK